eukprot:TRINITY_DN3405_c0_g1_i2.p1 TRINITY_DN3405_c0_g1~~TRINITY_DN3405_c0_g1_i2.p1  ORF type:complete len:339 (-),score=83.06 TRINITY_DN3405_c0_g1_i2:255-1244(-)
MGGKSFEERLKEGVIICGEGYLFELERRGYVQVGAYVPEVVLEAPEAVINLHREFLRCGSDVIEAFTYYGHREKMRLIGKEHLLKDLNVKALELAKQVAAEGDALVAGNICNTNIYVPEDEATHRDVRSMFAEQLGWAKEANVDFIIAETIDFVGEALLAVEEIKKIGLPSVVTLAVHKDGKLRDGKTVVEAVRTIWEAGATVVGLNCARGPSTMLPLLKELREALPEVPLAALPVPYNTTQEKPTFQSLCPLDRCYLELEPHLCTRFQMAEFAKQAADLGVKYIGVCCGGAPYMVRAMAEALGRHPPASKYSADLSKVTSFLCWFHTT